MTGVTSPQHLPFVLYYYFFPNTTQWVATNHRLCIIDYVILGGVHCCACPMQTSKVCFMRSNKKQAHHKIASVNGFVFPV